MSISVGRSIFLAIGMTVFPSLQQAQNSMTSGWLPIAQEELELKENSLSPGDPAIILYHEIRTDNTKSMETHYTRIKIFREEGKKYADIEIPYVENEIQVDDIQARTVRANGQAVEFSGAIFDKSVMRSRRVKLSVKSFSLPDVGPGSIVEYSYRIHRHRGVPDVLKNPGRYLIDGSYAYPAANWAVQRDLFVKKAHFELHPLSPTARVQVRAIRLPKMAEPKKLLDGTMQLDLENIPAYHPEDHSLPEDALRGRIFLFYEIGYYTNDGYWRDLGKARFLEIQKFLAKSKAVQQEVSSLIAPGDDPVSKLRKLYARAQQIRYLSYERSKTGKELKRENLKPNKNVEEVLTRGYAFANEINLLFVAMAREAGFQAFPVRLAGRNTGMFMESVPDPTQLDAEVVEVWTGPNVFFLDPATLHCPFGILPWEETDTQGLRLDEYRSTLVRIPALASSAARIERQARFKINQDGDLQGALTVVYSGQEALTRRIDGNDQDEAGRKKILEEEVKSWLPENSLVKLTSSAGWDETETPLKAAFDVQVPHFASAAGERLLLPLVVFQPWWKKAFQSSRRENPITFKYGYEEAEQLKLEVPPGYKIERLPVEQGADDLFASYQFSPEKDAIELKVERRFAMKSYLFQPSQYSALRGFLDYVRNIEDQQAVLHTVK